MAINTAYAFWPDWMPAPQQDSFSIQPEDRRLTSETEAGAIVRKQFDSDVNVADCTLVLNPLQSAWFESFERDVLKQGSIWFDFPLWIGGEIAYESCRFKTRPKAGNLIGIHTTYTFSLYVSKRTQLAFPPCLVEVFVCWPPCFFEKLYGLLVDFFAYAPSWKEGISGRTVDIFAPQFFILSNITEQAVGDALAGLTEE